MKIFLTGFPGFIGRRVVQRLCEKHPEAELVLLVEARLWNMAEDALGTMGLRSRCTLIAGDLVEKGLGIADPAKHLAGVTHVWHLAAIYDLSVSAFTAERVNVWGTVHVLELCEQLKSLERFMYFSTCFVAGKRKGVILENQLAMGQQFYNHYESTKYRAEIEVHSQFSRIPTTVVRPAIVVGDSQTGETDKYDGPYYMLQLLRRWPDKAPFPMIGSGTARFNVVPVDYVVDAAVALSELESAVGQTCQLADPDPVTTRELLDTAIEIMGKTPSKIRVPVSVLSGALGLSPIRKVMGLPKEAVAYADHDVRFDTLATQKLLRPVGITCPSMSEYLPVLVDYFLKNPHKSFMDRRKL